MKTTEINNPTVPNKRNLSGKLFNVNYSDLIRAIVLVLYILFLAEVTKAQGPMGTNENMPLLSMANTSGDTGLVGNHDADNSFLNKKKPGTFFCQGKASQKDSLYTLNNNSVLAEKMVKSYFRGIDAADDHYKAKKSGKAAIFFTTIIGGPVLGLVPAAACSAKVPSGSNLQVPKNANTNDDAFMRGYKGESHFIKKHNTWPCYVLASVIWLAIASLIVM